MRLERTGARMLALMAACAVVALVAWALGWAPR